MKKLSIVQKALLSGIRCYQATKFLRTPSCRFYPSCSQYMAGCVERHGVAKGTMLAVLRVLKCHPLHPGGVDKVPAEFSFSRQMLRAEVSNHRHKR